MYNHIHASSYRTYLEDTQKYIYSEAREMTVMLQSAYYGDTFLFRSTHQCDFEVNKLTRDDNYWWLKKVKERRPDRRTDQDEDKRPVAMEKQDLRSPSTSQEEDPSPN